MLVSLYTILLTATLTAFIAALLFAYHEHRERRRFIKEIQNVYFNEETKQLAILYTNGEFEIKNVLS